MGDEYDKGPIKVHELCTFFHGWNVLKSYQDENATRERYLVLLPLWQPFFSFWTLEQEVIYEKNSLD